VLVASFSALGALRFRYKARLNGRLMTFTGYLGLSFLLEAEDAIVECRVKHVSIKHELVGYEWIFLVKWLRADRYGASSYEELSSLQ